MSQNGILHSYGATYWLAWFAKHKDEPQHRMTGRIITKMLKLFDIKTCILRSNTDLQKAAKLIRYSKSKKKPVACIIEPKIFSKVETKTKKNNYNNLIFRPDAIECILNSIEKKTKIISTVGYASRELYQIKKYKKIKIGKSFGRIGGWDSDDKFRCSS